MHSPYCEDSIEGKKERSVISTIKQIKLLITVIAIRERRRINVELGFMNKIAKYFHLTNTLKVNSFFVIRFLKLSGQLH